MDNCNQVLFYFKKSSKTKNNKANKRKIIINSHNLILSPCKGFDMRDNVLYNETMVCKVKR